MYKSDITQESVLVIFASSLSLFPSRNQNVDCK